MCSQTLNKSLYFNRFSFLGLTTSIMVSCVLTAAPATAASLGKILTATGQVSIKRVGWSSYQPAAVGTSLDNGDLILPAAGSQVTLQCTNGTRQPVPSGTASGVANICPPPSSGNSDGTRGDAIAGIDTNIPYLISPRRTHLLSPTPTIRWNAVTGANSYRLRVRGAGVDWKTEVPTNEVVYSGETPLQPGQYYLITIITDTGANSNDDPGMQLGFTILDDSQKATLQAELTELSQQQLGQPAQTIAQAELYRKYQLNAQAIETLEAAINSNQATETIYFNLAALYEEIQLTQSAINNYLLAFQIASESADIITKTEAAEKLAKIYSALKDTAQFQRFRQEAIQGYEILNASPK
ncbi:MAG TPA: tetratricopeptide repeat protein [Oscillatoriaceae cyanobacterium M33_DOE_052]|uniref:Tetratricopeptide repeat protein n=1 Tax=Planktothricoides sp. SpSt-374 TaxID=2282167 RepID=A0A7C3ZGG0_9CYAN|nr:tetratricopeptide repeat protein [Oscillatoriaceae cyanobacterium M33_DOE_052]